MGGLASLREHRRREGEAAKTRACSVCLDGVPLGATYPEPIWLTALVSLAEEGSLRAAGRALGVSDFAISHRIAALTKHLGVGELVARGRITPTGYLAVASARQMLALMAAWAR